MNICTACDKWVVVEKDSTLEFMEKTYKYKHWDWWFWGLLIIGFFFFWPAWVLLLAMGVVNKVTVCKLDGVIVKLTNKQYEEVFNFINQPKAQV